jgi:hypothetical protein
MPISDCHSPDTPSFPEHGSGGVEAQINLLGDTIAIANSIVSLGSGVLCALSEQMSSPWRLRSVGFVSSVIPSHKVIRRVSISATDLCLEGGYRANLGLKSSGGGGGRAGLDNMVVRRILPGTRGRWQSNVRKCILAVIDRMLKGEAKELVSDS